MWEYKIVLEKDVHLTENRLNKYGKEDWELVTVTSTPTIFLFITYYFKRKLK